MDNAIKFSAKAERKVVDITCRAARDGVAISVRDYGPGVPRDQLQEIFGLFYRAENELTRETAVTGIGLALVRQLVEAMHGRVVVQNRAPGAEFRLTFPVSQRGGTQIRAISLILRGVRTRTVQHFPEPTWTACRDKACRPASPHDAHRCTAVVQPALDAAGRPPPVGVTAQRRRALRLRAVRGYHGLVPRVLVALGPDVILQSRMDIPEGGERNAAMDYWQRWPDLPAVKSGRVRMLAGSAALRPGPRVADAVVEIAELLHGTGARP